LVEDGADYIGISLSDKEHRKSMMGRPNAGNRGAV
jgi:hypothetical protein